MPLGRNSRFIDKKYLADQLRTVRLQHHYSMSEAAKLIGIATSTYSNYENSKIEFPSENFINRVLVAYPDKKRDYFVKDLREHTSSLPEEIRKWMSTKEAEPYIIQAYADCLKSKANK